MANAKNYETNRARLDARLVSRAIEQASLAKDSNSICDYFDKDQHYFLLRRRGRRLGWFVRAKGKTHRIGSVRKIEPNYLKPEEARAKAGKIYYDMKPRGALPRSGGAWTWNDLDGAYQEMLRHPRRVGNRIKPPVKDTQDEVRRHFNKPELQSWQKLKLAGLGPLDLRKLVDDIHARRGYCPCIKTMVYVKAALTWAQGEKTLESGLGETSAWWATMKPPQPDGKEIREMEKRHHTLVAAKDALTIEDMGKLLVIHEQYCAGREGNEKISPAVRWGIWWLVVTANRRLTATKLLRSELYWPDEWNPYSTPDQPWGVAEWPPEFAKAKLPFMLPIPPIGIHIACSCMSDWQAMLSRKRGFRSATQWVFASNRRRARRGHPENPDPGLYPNSLNAHLRALRGRKNSGKNETDLLKDLPDFWPHLIRSATTNFFAQHRKTLPAAAASAMLGHVLPSDRDIDWRRMSKTTLDYYLTAQHMDLKREAMKLWSERLMQAYYGAGGKLPAPREHVFDRDGPAGARPKALRVAATKDVPARRNGALAEIRSR